MCGIAGYIQLNSPIQPEKELVARMVSAIRHRGPDEFGAFFDDYCGLGQARLSIIDLAGGSQPMCNEDENLWISFNGEIFNYLELREELIGAGHEFRTKSDTEVIIHAYEQWGSDCLNRFNGQWAFVLYDRKNLKIFGARDRLGIRPLFYTVEPDRFYFASEIKSIFAARGIKREIDLVGLDQLFTWWTTAPPRTVFKGINELEAGCYFEVAKGQLSVKRYWSLDYPEQYDDSRSADSWAEELHELLVDAVRLRLRADVPVGAYLSGGLDSSATTALIKNFTDTPVETFSIAFHDKAYDESAYQQQMADFLGTNHHRIRCSYDDIAENFSDVIFYTEKPIVRTAPTPLYLLSRLVRENNFKVVLTGEGSDEMLGGYDIFKETMIRRFWARRPDSKWRPLLLGRLYPTLPLSGARARFYLETFYRAGIEDPECFHFSHIPRINTTTKIKEFFTDTVRQQLQGENALTAFAADLPDGIDRWHHLARAQFLEARSLLAGYILSSQGDRMLAAHAVEGRFPFLDYRVAELGCRIPPWYKILGLNEKFVLKKAMKRELPAEILARVKQPYMAPDSNSFFQSKHPEYIDQMMSADCLGRYGIFDHNFVGKLVEKCGRLSHAHLSFKDNMSFIGVLSTQLLMHKFIENFSPAPALEREKFTVWIDLSGRGK